MNERKPLTLEELTELGVRAENGESVFVYCTPLNEWCKVFKYGLLFFGTEDYRSWREIEETYEKHWLAYATKSPRLDRSAWKPCRKCKSCASCKDSISPNSEFPCYCCENYRYYLPRNFCPECGRPLTDAAWDMLENRMRNEE